MEHLLIGERIVFLSMWVNCGFMDEVETRLHDSWYTIKLRDEVPGQVQ